MELLKLNTSKSGVAFSEDLKQSAMAANSLLHSGKGAGNEIPFAARLATTQKIDEIHHDTRLLLVGTCLGHTMALTCAKRGGHSRQKEYLVHSHHHFPLSMNFGLPAGAEKLRNV